jgi:hypothetical protein
MGAEPRFLSSHTAVSGASYVQNAPDFQAVNGESFIAAGTLLSIDPNDGKTYSCDLATPACIPAGFAAMDHPLNTVADDTSKITIIRQGRIRGFAGLIPGALYYPSATTPGAIVPERTSAGPVITAVTSSSGSAFLKNVHIRTGHRPLAGTWTITFTSGVSCLVTPPGGSAGPSCTVGNNTAYNGTITGAEDFYIETGTLTTGDTAIITVSYTTEAAVVRTLASPGNAFTAVAPLTGLSGRMAEKGLYRLTTTSNSVTAGFNGSSQSAAKSISAGGVYFDIIPGFSLTAQGSSVTAETNEYNVDVQRPSAPVGIAIDTTTLQVLMGGIG